MALQSDDLAALGLGITLDQPPIPLQPALPSKGIHLRYATSFDRGLPWYGFYLFRRKHRSAIKQCLAPELVEVRPLRTKKSGYAFLALSIYTGGSLEFIDEFPAEGTAEIALPANTVLGAQFAEGPVYRVTAKVGFRRGVTKGGRVAKRAPAVPLVPGPVLQVRMVARDRDTIVGSTILSGRPGEVVTAEINADRITAVEFQPVDLSPLSKEPDRGAPVPSGRLPPSNVAHAALLDLCWDTVANALPGEWERVPGYPYPMALPVAEASYPCAGKPLSQTTAEALALSRVRYGSSSNWGGPNFAALHATLKKLVAGGPSGPAMRDRVDTFVDVIGDPKTTSRLPDQNLLQLVQLASLNPAMAQLLGLYWVDEQVVAGDAYDYIVLADHENAFGGKFAAALAAVKNGLPAAVDAWITFNHVAKPRAPLSAPARPKTVVLPDTAVNGAVGSGRGAAGINWDSLSSGAGYLQPDAPMMYLLWRHDHGAGQPLAPANVTTYTVLNPVAPCLVSRGGSVVSAQSPTNWPPFALPAVDRGLAEGWYSYAISGIDIWGRYSRLSAPGEWRQWVPAPDPLPWYYENPPADKQLHAFAVHILDKTPPPPPSAVEATALDPEDDLTYLRDGAYTAWWTAAGGPWWNGLTDAERAAVLPLRVRWRWYPAQEDQHPNTREFRIYFNPNSVPPGPDRFDSVNWQERIFVCGYNEHCTLVPQGAGDGPYRQYEVLLPTAPPLSVPPFLGVGLRPSLSEPVVYANISVSSADDRIHTDDQTKWNSTPWGGRYGNEGILAAPAKIYRVWRDLPPAPTALLTDQRVWATKADYHSHSFYTFRWSVSTGLKAHVYSVMDGTLFMVERAREDVATVSPTDIAALRTLWNPVPQRVIDQIAALRALKSSVSNNGKPTPSDAIRKKRDAAWDVACATLTDGALRGLAALPLHENSYVRQTASPVDDTDFVGPDDPAGYVPNSLWRAYKAMFDGRARNRYFLRVAYVDAAHNEGPLGPPGPPIYLPPAVLPRTPVIVKVTGGDRTATIAWTTANAEAGGSYTIYRTNNDYRLRDVRLMDKVTQISSVDLDPNSAQAEWTDTNGLEGGKTYYYCLIFIDANDNASEPSKPVPANVVDLRVPDPPAWTSSKWMIEDSTSGVLSDWPINNVVPTGKRPVVQLEWQTSVAGPTFVLTRRNLADGFSRLPEAGSGPTANLTNVGAYAFIDRCDPIFAYEYRLKVRSVLGVWSTESSVVQVPSKLPL